MITNTTLIHSGTGRLGNRIVRNLAVSLIAEKHNLKVNYCDKELMENLGIHLYSGTNVYDTCVDLTDHNFVSVYNTDVLTYNLNPNYAYFQTKDITNLLYNYLHTDGLTSNIIKQNPFNSRYKSNNDVFIHIRLGDVANFNPGINYYLNIIKSIGTVDNIYVSTDDPNHDIIHKLISIYPNIILVQKNEIQTFQFASTCTHVVLSHGSFSAIIGYLSFYSKIYYPEYETNKIWYGDMFSIYKWNKLSVN